MNVAWALFLEVLGTFALVKCGQLDNKIWYAFAWIIWHPLVEIDGNRWKNWNRNMEIITAVSFQLGGMVFSIDQI
jgi:hypothetical protein